MSALVILSRVLAGTLLAIALCAAPEPALAQKRGGTLVQITNPEPPSLAGYLSTSTPIGEVTGKIFGGLLEYGFDQKPQPSLAELLDRLTRRQDHHLQAAATT